MPGISTTSEEEDPGSMPGICNDATTEEPGEEDLGSIPGICNHSMIAKGASKKTIERDRKKMWWCGLLSDLTPFVLYLFYPSASQSLFSLFFLNFAT
jgi:hypothetical protein